jgi:hypothetical protein
MTTNNKRLTRTDRKARNAKVVTGIDKDLAPLGDPVQIGGEKVALSSLKAVFTDDSAAIDATDAARKAAETAVLHEKATKTSAAQTMKSLGRFIVGFFGEKAVEVLADFSMEPPKSPPTKTVTTKAVAVAKAKATRVARGTKGPVARKAIVGQVDVKAIEEAINAPKSPTASAEPAAATPAKPATPQS